MIELYAFARFGENIRLNMLAPIKVCRHRLLFLVTAISIIKLLIHIKIVRKPFYPSNISLDLIMISKHLSDVHIVNLSLTKKKDSLG